MIKFLALHIFGWRRTPERFAQSCAGYIPAYLKDHDMVGPEGLSKECLQALTQLAYHRAKKGEDKGPRLIHFFHELDLVAASVEEALLGREIADERVRIILAWHELPEKPNKAPQSNALHLP